MNKEKAKRSLIDALSKLGVSEPDTELAASFLTEGTAPSRRTASRAAPRSAASPPSERAPGTKAKRKPRENKKTASTTAMSASRYGVESYLRQIRKSVPLEREREQELARIIQNASSTEEERQAAIDELICANQRLAVNIAKQKEGLGLTIEDLISEGLIGLCKAARNFKPGVGKFSTIAYFHIRGEINIALNNLSRLIRIPSNQVRAISKSLKNEAGDQEDTGDLPNKYKNEFTGAARDAGNQPLSLNKEVGEDSDTTFADLIGTGEDAPDEIFHRKEVSEILMRALESLDPTERTLITSMYGIGDSSAVDEEDMEDCMNMSKSALRAVEQSAMQKLRSIAELQRYA